MNTCGDKELLGIFEDDFTCGICLKIYENERRKPKLLFCGHSICHACLLRCAKHNADKNKLECVDKDTARRFCCPLCKKKISLQPADVDKLPNNVGKMQLMEKIMGLMKKDVSKKTKISTCEKHVKDASHACETCDEFLCGTCMALSVTTGEHANHRVSLVKDYSAAKIELLMERKSSLAEARQTMIKKVAEADEDLEKAKGEIHRMAADLHHQIDDWQDDCYKEFDEALHKGGQFGEYLPKILDELDKKLGKEAEIGGSSSLKEQSALLEVTEQIEAAIKNYTPVKMIAQMKNSPNLTLDTIVMEREEGQTLEELGRQVADLWLGKTQGEATDGTDTHYKGQSPPKRAWMPGMTWLRVHALFILVGTLIFACSAWIDVAVFIMSIPTVIKWTAKYLPIKWHETFMLPGARVTRGPDWASSCDHDGGPGGVGSVQKADGDSVTVHWEKTDVVRQHRLSHGDGCYELRLV